jgi:hypothetical protein
VGFQGGGLERFGQAVQAGLFDGGIGGVAHGGLFKKKTAAQQMPFGGLETPKT